MCLIIADFVGPPKANFLAYAMGLEGAWGGIGAYIRVDIDPRIDDMILTGREAFRNAC